ncbi:MAG: VanZ family protein [Rufibacter sp.]
MRFKLYAPALGWAVLILIGTLLPAQALPPVPDWDLLSVDTLAHAVLFGGQLLLLLFGLRRDTSARPTGKTISICFLAVSAFGVLVEILQGNMGLGRAYDPADMVSNSIGCLLGLLAWLLVFRRF